MRILLLICYLIISIPAHAVQLLMDDEAEAVINKIAKPIYQAAGLGNIGLQVRILRDDAINAFVMDNKYIYVNSGLVTFSDNPEVLMGVIAHECGHIALGHISQRGPIMKEAQQQMIATFLLGAAAGILGSPEAAIGIMMGGSHAANINMLSHSRQHEIEADQAAAKYLNKNNLSTNGLIELLKHFNTNERIFFKDVNPYMITHPVSKERIDRLNSHSASSEHLSPALHDEFRMVYAKMFAFLNPPQKTFKQFNGNSPADIYAQAIAYYRKGSLPKALEKVDELLKSLPNNPYIIELKAQFLYEYGKIDQSITYYQSALNKKPRSLIMKVELASALISSKKPENIQQAEKMLEQVVEIEYNNYAAWRALGIALAKNNKNTLSNIALAQSMMIMEDIPAAKKFIKRIPAGEEEKVTRTLYKNILITVKEEKEKK